MKTSFFRTLAKQSLVATLVLGAISAAQAGTANSNLAVSATVAANCTISTTATAFGAYDSIVANATTALTANGTVTTTCTSGAAATVSLGQGANPAAGSTDIAPNRRLLSGASTFLDYALYSDATFATVFGDTVATGKAATGTGAAVATTVYGRIAAGQNVPAGSYTDTVIATVTF